MKKKILLLGFFLNMIVSLNAQTLSAGDIAIIGVNFDTSPNYEITIVTLAPIVANTQIRISDYWYNESTPNTLTNVSAASGIALKAEGGILWQPTAAITPGTVFKIEITKGANTVTGLPGNVTVTGWTDPSPTASPGNPGGENWFIYQGSSITNVSKFIFLWGNGFPFAINSINITAGKFVTTGIGNLSLTTVTYLPPSLTLGTNAIALTTVTYHGDNNVYTGIRIGTKESILAEICNLNKWNHHETTTYDITPGGTIFNGLNPIFTIITPPNTAPTDVALSATTISENVAGNSTIGSLTSTDANAGDTFTYTLVAGTGDTDNASFNINDSDLRITASPDFETKSSYSVRILTTDQGGLTFEKVFTITVNNVNEAPTDVALSANTINENVSANSAVGTLSSTDVDTSSFTYTLVAGTGDTDNTAFAITGNSLTINASPDFETKSSYSVRVSTFDGTSTLEKAFTITINDLNDAPTDIALSTSAINENVAANSTVGTLSSTDADTSNTFTYTLVAGAGSTDNTAFSITGNSLTINASPDFETKSSYSVRIRTTDQGGLTFDKQFTITINDLAEGVLLNSSPTLTFTSNSAAITGDDIASDGEGGSQTISDIDIQVYNISNINGTLLPALSLQNNTFMASSSTSYTGLTNENNAGSKGMAIKSANGSEFRLNQFIYYNWGEASSFTNTVKGYRDGSEVASTTFDGFDSDYTPKTITLTSAFQNVDEVRFYITAGGYFNDQAATNHSINSIQVSSPVVASNTAPTNIALSATSINENVSANSAVGTLSSTDADASNTFTYTLVAGTGSTDNTAFTITGNSLTINASPDFETKSSYSVRIRTTDQGGLTFEKVFTITVNNVNEAPTDVALSANTINENVSANSAVGTLSSTDVDTSSFTYTLVAGTGDTDNTAFAITGNSLTINASPDFETKSSYSVRVSTFDGTSTLEKAFTITINDLNEAPTDIALSAAAINENAAANATIGTLSSTDADAANTFTYTLVAGTGSTDNASFNISGSSLRITSSPDFETKSSYSVRVRTTDQGSLTFEKAFTITINNLNEAPTDIALSAAAINENAAANATIGTLSSTDADTGNTFTYTLVAGTGSTDNASFNFSGSSLRITSSPDFETKSSYSVRVRTTDQGSLTFEKAFTITINDLNEAPMDIFLSAAAINENAAANATIGTLSSTDADAGDTFTYTLVAGTGSMDNPSFNLDGSSLRITSSPDFETKSSYSVRVRTTDQGSLIFEKAFTITINDLNEAPTGIALSAAAINENVAANSVVGTLSSADPDSANTFTYTLVTGTESYDNTFFNISGTSLRITSSPDFETKSNYWAVVRTTDQGGLTFDKIFLIFTTNLNEAPTNLDLSASTINDKAAANSAVGTLSSTDPEHYDEIFSSETFTYTLVTGTGSNDNAAFNISGSSLRITASPDFETKSSYSVRVRTTDQGSLTFEKAFTITINDLNEAPTDIALSAAAINENAAANATIGTLSSTDADAANTFTYTLVAGTGSTDNASFNISGSSLRITSSPDFETKSSYSVRVRTTDQGSLTFEKAFTITINNLNEAPTDIALSAAAINENAAANATIGTLSSTDADTGNTFTYTLVAGTGSTDNAAFNFSGSTLRITSSPDFEAKSSYSIRVRTTDQGSLTFEKAFTISINDLNEAPTDIALSAAAINENAAANATIGTLSSTDADTGNTFTYTLVAGTGSTDNASFNISGSTLRITSSPNFETKSSYSVRVRTTDQGNLTFEKEFTITINDLNEAPTDIALSAATINENTAANATIGTLSSTHADTAKTLTYTLVAGTGSTDNASFNISGSTLRITSSPDFETKSSYSVRVRTTDQGNLTFEKAFTITINDLCELNNLVTQTSGVLTINQTGATYQWYNCADNSPIGTNSGTFAPKQSGDYKVDITQGNCTVTSACISVTTLGITNFETNSQLLIYPNPSQGIVNIKSNSAGDFQVANQLGQIVKTFKVEANVITIIDLQNLNESVYFIKENNQTKHKSYKLLMNK
jgi:hypothetical protein